MFLNLGVKAAAHGGPDVDPDNVDRTPLRNIHRQVRRFLRGHLPELSRARISHTEVCLYTVAPGDQFQVDYLPGRNDVLVASPCSGHGFKFSCLIGQILADLVTAGKTDVAIQNWKL